MNKRMIFCLVCFLFSGLLSLAEAKIPDGVREALVTLSLLAKPEGDLLFHAKAQDLAKSKGGDRLFSQPQCNAIA